MRIKIHGKGHGESQASTSNYCFYTPCKTNHQWTLTTNQPNYRCDYPSVFFYRGESLSRHGIMQQWSFNCRVAMPAPADI